MLRDLLSEHVNVEEIVSDIAKCNVRDRVAFLLKLLEFVLPRLQAVTVNEIPPLKQLIQMTPEERRSYLFELMRDEKKKNTDELIIDETNEIEAAVKECQMILVTVPD